MYPSPYHHSHQHHRPLGCNVGLGFGLGYSAGFNLGYPTGLLYGGYEPLFNRSAYSLADRALNDRYYGLSPYDYPYGLGYRGIY